MGSGHILVYAFDVLMQIYHSQGYTDLDATESIVRYNLYGLDIDDRAAQLAYFAVLMKAAQYDKHFLRRGIQPNLCAIQESNGVEVSDKLQGQMSLSSVNVQVVEELITQFRDAKTYGSLLNPHMPVIPEDFMQRLEQACGNDLETMEWYLKAQETLTVLIQQGNILSGRYDVVVTNPPYLNKLESNLKSFVQVEYKDFCADLFSVFIYRNFALCKSNGYNALMTPFVWMFIKSYEKLREFIINRKSITTLIQLEYSAFEEATVPLCTFVLRNLRQNYSGVYLRLTDFRGGMAAQDAKVLEAREDPNCKYRYPAQQENFIKIPGMPIAYWAGEALLQAFVNGKRMDSLVDPRQGLATADNSRFLRQWYEIANNSISFNSCSVNEAIYSQKKWFPYNKGGERRQWYGNYDYVVNWEHNGKEIKSFYDENGKQRSVVRNPQYHFQEAITWGLITSGGFSIRYRQKGSIHDVAGMSAFSNNRDLLLYLLAIMSTHLADYVFKMINPTINLQIGDFNIFPVLYPDERKAYVIALSEKSITLSRTDWDSFETSWDFKRHPLI